MSYILCFSLYSNRDGDSDDRDQCPMWTFPTVRPSSMNKLQKGYTNTDSEVRIPTFHSCFRNEMTVRFVSCHYRSFKKKEVQNNTILVVEFHYSWYQFWYHSKSNMWLKSYENKNNEMFHFSKKQHCFKSFTKWFK